MYLDDTIGNYKIEFQLGKGSFGIVYKVRHIVTNKSFAMKLENKSVKANNQLKNEYKTYQKLDGCACVPNVHYFGMYEDRYYLILDLLGPNLQDIFENRGMLFSLKTCCMIAKRLIDFFESVHRRGILFRDLKPENIVIDDERPHELYVIDFGMAKSFLIAGVHVAMETNKSLTGTARYASINTHLGYSQSRRDDLETMMYTIIYFLKPKLPWMGLKAPTGQTKYKRIAEVKQNTPINTLVEGLPNSKNWGGMLSYIRELKFDELPDYQYLRNTVDKILKENKLVDDKNYDWINKKIPSEPPKFSFWKYLKKILRGDST
ncbi:Casein kinase I like protein 2 [Dictyocoela muelleri]|nr:Casein kinase I like protein 2 [Dictyocoela muelleri]